MISYMRLLSLDYDPVYGDDDTVRSSFSSDVSVFDFDAVIWDPAESFRGYRVGAARHNGEFALTDSQSFRVKEDARRRAGEFREFVDAGRVLVVIVRGPLTCYVATGEVSYSGTGRNRAKTRHIAPFDFWSALPLESQQIISAAGSRIDVLGDDDLARFMKKHKKFLGYEAVLKSPSGFPRVKIAGTNKVVSSLVTTEGGGQILLLCSPRLRPAGVHDDNSWFPESESFQDELLAGLRSIGNAVEQTRPAWAGRYVTADQRAARSAVQKQKTRVESARKKLATLEQASEEAAAKSQLFLGTGRALELEVRAVLELLGGIVTDPEPGRDDWRVKFPEGPLVVEVKGVSKSAAEKHAAQLEKWVAGHFESTGVMAKGVLVANTWKDVPLGDRSDQDFPSQMLPYSTSRGHCLMTGLELFVIRALVEADENAAPEWRKKILATAGRIADIPDWRTVVEEQSETVER